MRRDVLMTLWRTVVVWSLMFWQGGFLFYASAVVPTAQDIIGHKDQGFITRKVTVWLNMAAAASLALLAIDAAIFPDPRPRRRWLLWSTLLMMTLCQAALFTLHPLMDSLLDPATHDVGRGFRPLHRAYLWVHTVQWGFAVALTALLFAAWRNRDREVA